jgi:hypothetical protein
VHARLDRSAVVVGALLPLCLIVTVLWFLNLDRVVFGIMSGNQDDESGNTLAYVVLTWITLSAVAVFLPLACAYGLLCYRARGLARVGAGTAARPGPP